MISVCSLFDQVLCCVGNFSWDLGTSPWLASLDEGSTCSPDWAISDFASIDFSNCDTPRWPNTRTSWSWVVLGQCRMGCFGSVHWPVRSLDCVLTRGGLLLGQGCWCRRLQKFSQKKALIQFWPQKLTEWQFLVLCLTRKMKACEMMVFHAFHHVLLWPGWRLKHLTPGDHFCRIWTLEPFFVDGPNSGSCLGRATWHGDGGQDGRCIGFWAAQDVQSSTGILLGCSKTFEMSSVYVFFLQG